MRAAEQPQLLDKTRETILDAARTRLLHFGYNKTTMAEIAEDAGMSAANLYRYFENKQEIVVQCVVRTVDERLDLLRTVAQRSERSAAARLEDYALALIEDSYALAGPDSRIGELVDNIARERPDIVRDKNGEHCKLLAEILRAGIAAGEFAIDDIETCARALNTAFTLFDVPLFAGLYPRQEFDQRAQQLVALLINGMRAARPA